MASKSSDAVVVGDARGIGEAVVRRLVVSGTCASVVVTDIDAKGMEELRSSLMGYDCEVTTREVDVRDDDSVNELVEASAGVKAVVITTGFFAASPSLETGRQELRRILNVNCEDVFFVAQAFARQVVASGEGSIVAISSIAARMPRMREAAYSASKAGLRQALQVLGMEVASLGVRINMVAQGDPEAFRIRIPMGKVATLRTSRRPWSFCSFMATT